MNVDVLKYSKKVTNGDYIKKYFSVLLGSEYWTLEKVNTTCGMKKAVPSNLSGVIVLQLWNRFKNKEECFQGNYEEIDKKK